VSEKPVSPAKNGRFMRINDPNTETVGSLELKLGFPPGTFRNSDGRDTRSDKKIDNIRKEWQRQLERLKKRRAKANTPRTLDLFSELDPASRAA
jgi:hypothetical protein